jgi:hypothetical protein
MAKHHFRKVFFLESGAFLTLNDKIKKEKL